MNEATQRELVWWLAKGLSKEQAAERAGLPSSGRLYHFARTSEFASALRDGMLEHMSTELAPKALRILDEIMSDPAVSPRVRADAVRTVLDRSGYAARSTPGPHSSDKLLSELSMPELRRLVDTLEQAQSESDRIIDGELAISVDDILA